MKNLENQLTNTYNNWKNGGRNFQNQDKTYSLKSSLQDMWF